MPPVDSFEQKKVDPRIYLGILVFRWKLIVICFLYCMLGGVAYLQFAPKEYDTGAAIMIYRDPSTQILSQAYHWSQSETHVSLLQSEAFQNRVVEKLRPRWLKRLGGDSGELWPGFKVSRGRGAGISIGLSIRNSHPAYARAYLTEAIKQFQVQRELVKVNLMALRHVFWRMN